MEPADLRARAWWPDFKGLGEDSGLDEVVDPGVFNVQPADFAARASHSGFAAVGWDFIVDWERFLQRFVDWHFDGSWSSV